MGQKSVDPLEKSGHKNTNEMPHYMFYPRKKTSRTSRISGTSIVIHLERIVTIGLSLIRDTYYCIASYLSERFFKPKAYGHSPHTLPVRDVMISNV
jgi:hypothetical protein